MVIENPLKMTKNQHIAVCGRPKAADGIFGVTVKTLALRLGLTQRLVTA